MQCYKTKGVIIEATKLTADVRLGTEQAKAGDWLVIGADGQPYFISDETFFLQFEPCDDEDERPTRFAQERKAKTRVRKNGPAKPALYATSEDAHDQ